MKENSSQYRDKLSILFQSSLTGVFRGMIGLPFEHPFDNIKTNMQAYQKNVKQTILGIYQKQGTKGFYSGFVVNFMRVASKEIYRWPLQIALFGFYRNVFDEKISRGTLGSICGINMAIIEAFILCPFQRIKVWLMTASKNSKMRQFFKTLQVKAIFDGLLPVFCKQFVSWVTFLGSTQFFKDLVYKCSKKNRFQHQLTPLEVAQISVCTAFVNTFFVMPIDCIKTNYQKNLDKQHYQKMITDNNRFKNTIKQIYIKFGWQGFFKGWQIRLIQYNINSLFTVMIFERLLKQYEKNVMNGRKIN